MAKSAISVFLSYRRDDTRHVAGRLADRLREQFEIFMDTDTEPGTDYMQTIRREVSRCDVLVAVIGVQWTTILDTHGHRRLDDPKDWVVEEIRVALERNIRVIPVLVDDARMPEPDELPSSVDALANRQALALRHESFGSDASRLAVIILNAAPNREAQKLQRLAELYERAAWASAKDDWSTAVPAWEAVVADNDEYRDAVARFEYARTQKRVFELRADITRLHRAGQWADVIAANDELLSLDPESADPQGIAAEARTALAKETMATRYAAGLAQYNNHAWADAIVTLESIWQDYRDTAPLIDKAREQIRLELFDDVAARAADSGDWGSSVTALERLVAIDPHFRNGSRRLIVAREKLGETERGGSLQGGKRRLLSVSDTKSDEGRHKGPGRTEPGSNDDRERPIPENG